MLTWTARDASNVSNSATGQETAPPPGKGPEMPIVEPPLLPDIPTAHTSQVTEFNLNPVKSSEVFDEEVADIAQVHCENESFEFELLGLMSREISEKT